MTKRLLDLLASGLGLVLLSPLFCLIGLAVRLDSRGPILYKANRIGQYGREFRIYKFRSMVSNADQHGPGITTADDNRITSVGRFLRRTKFDELPQLINVFWGEMSLVGPRPEDTRYVALYTPEQCSILRYRPGITSMASLKYRHEEQMLSGNEWEQVYVNVVMPTKLAIDLEYAEKANILSDILLIIRTVFSH